MISSINMTKGEMYTQILRHRQTPDHSAERAKCSACLSVCPSVCLFAFSNEQTVIASNAILTLLKLQTLRKLILLHLERQIPVLADRIQIQIPKAVVAVLHLGHTRNQGDDDAALTHFSFYFPTTSSLISMIKETLVIFFSFFPGFNIQILDPHLII